MIAVYCTVSLSLQSVLPVDPDLGLFVNQEQYFQKLDPETDPGSTNTAWRQAFLLKQRILSESFEIVLENDIFLQKNAKILLSLTERKHCKLWFFSRFPYQDLLI
jgi:hypothetical protein